MMKNRLYNVILRIMLSLAMVVVICGGICQRVKADNLDEIEKYVVTANVLDDATVELKYHIEWRVLDSYSEGPLDWVHIGIPNSYVEEYYDLSNNIEDADLVLHGSASYIDIYFKKSYEEGEVVKFDFTLKQNNLYQMNRDEDETTVYSFTPGWFDEIMTDKLIIKWNAENAKSWEPNALVKKGYLTWETSLSEGDSFTIEVSYPNEAYNFSQEVSDRYEETDYDGDNDWDGDDWEYDDGDEGAFFIFYIIFAIIYLVVRGLASNEQYNKSAGFGPKTETKITRTKVVYHTNCPNCGAPRAEGKEVCEYCGTNLIKSEEILKEETLTKEEKEQYTKDGEFAYSTIPNTYIRVHTVHVPVPHSSSGSSGRSRGGGGCAHSSCACACASCACACACACAGGGRAGCSNKDFYKKSLKLKMLEKFRRG